MDKKHNLYKDSDSNIPKITYNNRNKITSKIERLTGIKPNVWYFKKGCRSLKLQIYITDSNKIALRFHKAGIQQKENPNFPTWYTLGKISYYTTFSGCVKRIIKSRYPEKFKGRRTRKQQLNFNYS